MLWFLTQIHLKTFFWNTDTFLSLCNFGLWLLRWLYFTQSFLWSHTTRPSEACLYLEGPSYCENEMDFSFLPSLWNPYNYLVDKSQWRPNIENRGQYAINKQIYYWIKYFLFSWYRDAIRLTPPNNASSGKHCHGWTGRESTPTGCWVPTCGH